MPNLQLTAPAIAPSATLAPTDTFVNRHIGPNSAEVKKMLSFLGFSNLESLIEQTVPPAIS
jgi:glycine dehydrogenase